MGRKKIEKMIPEDRIVIDIKKGGNNLEERILYISGFGKGYERIIKEMNWN